MPVITEDHTISETPNHFKARGQSTLADLVAAQETSTSNAARETEKSETSRLDICILSGHDERVSELNAFFQSLGHRTTLTSPSDMPDAHEWESYDLVLLDPQDGETYPQLPLKLINHLVCLCDNTETNDPAALRSALHVGARELLPRRPSALLWKPLLGRVKASAPDVCIRCIDPNSSVERQIPITGEELTMGRDAQNDACFPQRFVSRLHARIERAGKRYRLVDGGSRHGTFVNGQRIDEHLLTDGDRIQLGGDQGPSLTFSVVLMTEHTLQMLESSGIFDPETVNQSFRDISVLLETILSLNSDLLLDDILELVVRRAIDHVQADRGVILLRELSNSAQEKVPPLGELAVAVALDRQGQPLDVHTFAIEMNVPEQVARTGVGINFQDQEAAEAFYSGGNQLDEATLSVTAASSNVFLERTSGMCVPLKVRRKHLSDHRESEVIGVLYVDSARRSRPYSTGTLEALTILASEVANSIYTARLYEDSLENRRHEEEMDIARRIQKNIFHDQEFQDDSWQFFGSTRPSQEVGGDLLSTFPITESQHAVLVGDVSGKGVPAALFSTMLEGVFYGLACSPADDLELGDTIGTLNRFLVSRSRLQKFVTAIFGILEPGGTFHYVNAGHNPGLLLGPNNRREEIGASGTVLGMFDDSSYDSRSLELNHGDVVILYSDGITESRNAAGEEFGVDQLEKVLRRLLEDDPHTIHDGILRAFHGFLAGEKPSDDLTLMVIKRI